MEAERLLAQKITTPAQRVHEAGLVCAIEAQCAELNLAQEVATASEVLMLSEDHMEARQVWRLQIPGQRRGLEKHTSMKHR